MRFGFWVTATLQASSVELVEFLREIDPSYESMAASKKIKYFFYPEIAERVGYIDKEKIEKVVHNLLSNAFKFTENEGKVILNLKSDGKHCICSVALLVRPILTMPTLTKTLIHQSTVLVKIVSATKSLVLLAHEFGHLKHQVNSLSAYVE